MGLVVEGSGDAGAVPLLLRRYLHGLGEFRDLLGNGRENALKPKGLEGYVATAAARPGCIAVIVVLDSEGDPVCRLGPSLTKRAEQVTQKPVLVSIAHESYGDWIVASAETLGPGLNFQPGMNGLAAISAALRPAKYVKPTWQPRLTQRIDIEVAASRNASLHRFFARFEDIIKSFRRAT